MLLRLAVALFAAGTLSVPAASAGCDKQGTRQARSGCARAEAPKKFEPYDPSAARAGSRQGFIDVGGGTEVRIGGRVRADYQYTR
ncbi:hypothetical protein [Enterovirga sp.]|uniref:hypothetical protein n=1 Tax=Enterovirga sp. TaxID=2026350 RepID=UPI002B752D71|nr:hypothetical protein [Enterovirga sp.]HMO29680.1 hypothetical protein [Enterovirga sp.]